MPSPSHPDVAHSCPECKLGERGVEAHPPVSAPPLLYDAKPTSELKETLWTIIKY